VQRRLLASFGLVALVLLAGCSAAGSLTMTDVDERPLAEQASRDADRLADRDAETSRVLERAIENGTATTTGTHPPVRDGLPIEHDGAYYDAAERRVEGFDLGGSAVYDASEADRSLLATDEREVVAGAIEGSYHAESSDDAAFRSIVERFRRHGAVRSDEYRGEYVVRYRGELYWAELRYGEFVEGEPAVAREFDPSAGPPTVRPRSVARAS
jgi:hypothetical protein